MKTFIVEVSERHIQKMRVTAESPEEARKKAASADYDDLLGMEYVETLGEPEEWSVEEVKPKP